MNELEDITVKGILRGLLTIISPPLGAATHGVIPGIAVAMMQGYLILFCEKLNEPGFNPTKELTMHQTHALTFKNKALIFTSPLLYYTVGDKEYQINVEGKSYYTINNPPLHATIDSVLVGLTEETTFSRYHSASSSYKGYNLKESKEKVSKLETALEKSNLNKSFQIKKELVTAQREVEEVQKKYNNFYSGLEDIATELNRRYDK